MWITVTFTQVRSGPALTRVTGMPAVLDGGATQVDKISRFKTGLFLLSIAAATLVAILLLPFELLRQWAAKSS